MAVLQHRQRLHDSHRQADRCGHSTLSPVRHLALLQDGAREVQEDIEVLGGVPPHASVLARSALLCTSRVFHEAMFSNMDGDIVLLCMFRVFHEAMFSNKDGDIV